MEERERENLWNVMRQPSNIKNQDNVLRYRKDICEALAIPFEERMINDQFFVDMLLGDQRDHVEFLGLLNRGFCPICGHEPIDKTYRRQFNFGRAIEYMCADCFAQINEITAAHRQLGPPGYKRRYYIYKSVKWAIKIAILVGLYYLVRACLRLF